MLRPVVCWGIGASVPEQFYTDRSSANIIWIYIGAVPCKTNLLSRSSLLLLGFTPALKGVKLLNTIWSNNTWGVGNTLSSTRGFGTSWSFFPHFDKVVTGSPSLTGQLSPVYGSLGGRLGRSTTTRQRAGGHLVMFRSTCFIEHQVQLSCSLDLKPESFAQIIS